MDKHGLYARLFIYGLEVFYFQDVGSPVAQVNYDKSIFRIIIVNMLCRMD